jgi:undecaprenyl phosphate-alpha-L-ara4FN deformylase
VSAAPPTLALRVDIDTYWGCRDGVPRLARALDRLGVRASFFAVAGRDTSGRHVERLKQPGYLRRLRAVGVVRTLRRLRFRSLLYGLVLPGPLVAGGNAALLRALATGGHEIGCHGLDHAAWAEHVQDYEPDRVRHEWAQAQAALEAALGFRPESGAAPNWRVSDAALEVFDEQPWAYRSDVRGRAPFLPVTASGERATLQIPVTLPACHELMAVEDLTLPATAARVVGALDPARPNVWNLHDWFEGLRAPWIVAEVVTAARARGYRVVTMRELADELKASGEPIPTARVERRPIPGGVGTVSCQAE